MVNEIVWVAATALGNEGVADIAIQELVDGRTNAAISTVGLINPVPGTSRVRHALEATEDIAGNVTKYSGHARRQERLRELAKDDRLGSADRGWIQQEINAIDRGKRETIRNPPGTQLAHTRGREAAKGYDHIESPSQLQDRDLHRTQHKFDDFGRKNKERP